MMKQNMELYVKRELSKVDIHQQAPEKFNELEKIIDYGTKSGKDREQMVELLDTVRKKDFPFLFTNLQAKIWSRKI